MTRVGVVGASARAAVHSLARAGCSAWAVDLFADRDLKLIAECAVCPADRYPDALPALAAQFPPGPLIYTGGLENHPHTVAALASHHELWGNSPDVLARVRDPFALAACRVAAPRLVPFGAPCPSDGRWLRKPHRSGGGLGIRFARPSEPASPQHYFQEFIDGLPMSAIYLDGTFFGITEQLIGERWLHATGFTYCGNIGPACVPDGVTFALRELGRVLVDSFGLRGVFGVDFVLAEGEPYVVEVNPRYTAAVEVLEHASCEDPTPRPPPPGGEGEESNGAVFTLSARGRPTPPGPPSLKGRGVTARSASCASVDVVGAPRFYSPFPSGRGAGGVGLPRAADVIGFSFSSSPSPPGGGGRGVGSSHMAKAIYYAIHTFTFPHSGPWDADLASPFDPWRLPTFADIPEPGARIEAGDPVLTFFATGTAPAEVRERLQSRAAELDQLFAESHS